MGQVIQVLGKKTVLVSHRHDAVRPQNVPSCFQRESIPRQQALSSENVYLVDFGKRPHVGKSRGRFNQRFVRSSFHRGFTSEAEWPLIKKRGFEPSPD